jgi:hypothetical protein
MATSRWAVITFVDQGPANVPDNSLPGQPVYPSQGLPGVPVYPSQGLPGGGHISLLPVFPFDPTRPSNELPGDQPEVGNDLPIRPGKKFVVKWLCGAGMILVPDNELPETPEPK